MKRVSEKTMGTAKQVIDLLTSAYRLTPITVDRLPIGQGTVNYKVTCAEGPFFVKHYPADVDLADEVLAIDQSASAGRQGVPVAPLLPATNGKTIIRHGQTAISVWAWVDGETAVDGFSLDQQRAAGQALGRIHAAFAAHPASSGTAPEPTRWLAVKVGDIRADIDKLLALISVRENRNKFDVMAEQTLTERRVTLARVPALLAGLPELSTQVLHGDYSAVNLLFNGDDLAAVLDFRPPVPFLTAFELGRIAFDPRTVVLVDNWQDCALALAEAYLYSYPAVAGQDVQACARVALLQLLTSLYGVRNHYLKPGLLQDDLDAFWLLRHRAATRILKNLPDLEYALEEITARTANRASRV